MNGSRGIRIVSLLVVLVVLTGCVSRQGSTEDPDSAQPPSAAVPTEGAPGTASPGVDGTAGDESGDTRSRDAAGADEEPEDPLPVIDHRAPSFPMRDDGTSEVTALPAPQVPAGEEPLVPRRYGAREDSGERRIPLFPPVPPQEREPTVTPERTEPPATPERTDPRESAGLTERPEPPATPEPERGVADAVASTPNVPESVERATPDAEPADPERVPSDHSEPGRITAAEAPREVAPGISDEAPREDSPGISADVPREDSPEASAEAPREDSPEASAEAPRDVPPEASAAETPWELPEREGEETVSAQTAAPGETIEVRLPGRSWLYLGSTGPVEFLSRETPVGEDVTLFTFQVRGPAALEFEAQDLVTGRRQRHLEEIEAAPGPSSRLTQGSTGRDDTDSGTGQSGNAGGSDDAVQSGSTAVPERAGRSENAGETGGPEPAGDADRIEANDLPVTAEAPVDEEDVGERLEFDLRGFLESVDSDSLDPDSHRMVLAALTGERPDEDLPIDPLIRYGDLLVDNDRLDDAAELFETIRNDPVLQNDAILFRLATLYERNSPLRDLQRSRELYERLRDRYPFSEYYQDAGKRIQFLDRHFFHIR
ncbi:MAG: hypothetical protein ACLFSV_02520 [Alkalispirochaeta sp.]